MSVRCLWWWCVRVCVCRSSPCLSFLISVSVFCVCFFGVCVCTPVSPYVANPQLCAPTGIARRILGGFFWPYYACNSSCALNSVICTGEFANVCSCQELCARHFTPRFLWRSILLHHQENANGEMRLDPALLSADVRVGCLATLDSPVRTIAT